MERRKDPEARERSERGHANGAGHGGPASERVGESEGRSPLDDDGQQALERVIHAELTQLPPPRAPHTLLPRVMQAVESGAHQAWVTRAWFVWPWWAQAGSLAAVSLVVYGLWRLPLHVPAAPPSLAAAAGTTRVIWEALIQPLLPYLAAVMVLMGLACVLFGAALNYVLLERVEQRR